MEMQLQKCQIFIKQQPVLQNSNLQQNRGTIQSGNAQKSIKCLNPDRKNQKKSNSHQRNSLFRDLDQWQPSQIQKLFRFYDIHGPQWKNMSLSMSYRTANNLKNKFYTVLRNLIKTFFRANAQLCPKLAGEISSKDLCRLYDGRQDYQAYQGFIRQILETISYDLSNPRLGQLSTEKSQIIQEIYKTINREKLRDNQVELPLQRLDSQHNPQNLAYNQTNIVQQQLIFTNQNLINKNINYGNNSEGQYFYYFLIPSVPSSFSTWPSYMY